MSDPKDLYFVHLSIHGLIRGHDLELGRDADTGGQCKYVLELVKALAKHESVGQVDLLTRAVIDPKVGEEYGHAVEDLGDGAFIRRIEVGPKRYLRKESLWRYLDGFVDQALASFRARGRLPDVIHAHYADAGYVGSRLASLLGCPFIFTGHSLGRTKLRSLLESKVDRKKIEKNYNISARIEAEEMALDSASLVCTSTSQEVENQYALYENYAPELMRVIPPGVDVSRYSTPSEGEISEAVREKIDRFLDDPDRPAILAIARADEKKNLATLVKAFGESAILREKANLVLVAGNRDHIRDLKPGARKVWTELLQLIDDYDLYGCVSIPKHHEPGEIPGFYRYAAEKKGLFVNPALIEPFGLTIIEAAASGLPVLATNDGGPNDILGNCQNGILIDPLDREAMTKALESALSDEKRWRKWAASGLQGISDHYTWETHVETYMKEISGLIAEITEPSLIIDKVRTSLPLKDRIIFCGLENELQEGDAEAIAELKKLVDSGQPKVGFGISTARSLERARELVQIHGLPEPDVYLTQLGAEIHYGKRLVKDAKWDEHLAHRWDAEAIRQVLAKVEGLTLQEEKGSQHRFKVSYHVDKEVSPKRSQIQKLLRENHLSAKVIFSQDSFLDIVPLRSGKGQSVRYVALRWGIPFDRVLYYARRGSDYGALSGEFLGVLGADHADELASTHDLPSVYLASKPNFMGLLEGIKAYHFDSDIEIPASAEGMSPSDDDREESVLAPDLTINSAEEHKNDE